MIFSHHPFFEPAVRVAELEAGGTSARPFPTLEWNTPRPGTDEYLDSVLGVRGDEEGVIWMLDMGTRTGVTPKLVGWNTRSNRLERIYRVAAPASSEVSQHNDFVVDRRHGAFYLADEGIAHGGDGSRAALVVVDMATGTSRRLLEGDVSTRPERRPIVAEGVQLTVRGANGTPTPLLAGADGICADAQLEWLYFGPLNGRWVYRVRTADLRDASLSEAALRGRVERYAEEPNNGGMSIDDDGNLYLTEVGAHAVGIIPRSTRRYRRLAEHPELIWPDGVDVWAGRPALRLGCPGEPGLRGLAHARARAVSDPSAPSARSGTGRALTPPVASPKATPAVLGDVEGHSRGAGDPGQLGHARHRLVHTRPGRLRPAARPAAVPDR